MLATVTVLNTTTINWFNESTVLFNYVLITYSIFISDRNWFYFPSFVLQCTWYPFCLFINSVWKKRCSVKLNTYLKNKIYTVIPVMYWLIFYCSSTFWKKKCFHLFATEVKKLTTMYPKAWANIQTDFLPNNQWQFCHLLIAFK